MEYTFKFNDFELRDLDSILIQPKRDGNGYTVHRVKKSKPGDGWDEWRKKIEKTFDIAQENKKTDEEHQKEVAAVRHELLIANDSRDYWNKKYLQTCKKVEDIQAEIAERDNRIEKLQNNFKHLEEKVDDLQTELNNVEESAATWKKKYKELYGILKIQNCSDSMKMHHIAILSKTERIDDFKFDNNFDIWEARFSDHKTLNGVFKNYFVIDNDNGYEFTELIRGIESAFKRFNREHDLSMFEFFVYLGYYHFLRLLDSSVCKALVNTKWTESNPFDCNLNIVPPCGEDDNTVSYYIVFSTAPKYVGDEN